MAPSERQVFRRDLLPPIAAVHQTKEGAVQSLKEHAKWHGYAISVRRSFVDGRIHLSCSRRTTGEGRVRESDRKRNRKSCGTSCPWDVRLYPVPDGMGVRIAILNGSHNHQAFLQMSDHYQHRRMTPEQETFVAEHLRQGTTTAQILALLNEENNLFLRSDVQNAVQRIRRAAAAAGTASTAGAGSEAASEAEATATTSPHQDTGTIATDTAVISPVTESDTAPLNPLLRR